MLANLAILTVILAIVGAVIAIEVAIARRAAKDRIAVVPPERRTIKLPPKGD